MDQDKNVTQLYLQHCRLGLAFAEDVVRRCCQTEITHLQVELRTAFEKNECIRETELDIRRMEGWDSSKLKFQHFCHEKPACYDFLKRIADKLSTASKVNPYTLFMNISLQNCKDDDWEIAKLFLEPWMLECRGLEDLNAYCLLEMLGNLKIVNENDIAKTKKQTNITTLHKEHINKMRYIAETFFLTENEQITKEDKCIFLQAIINVLAFEPGPETDEVIQKIQEVMELEDSVTTGISLPRLTGCTAKSIHALMYKTEKKDRVLKFQKNNWFLKMQTNGISSLYRLLPMGIFHPVLDDTSNRKSKELDEPPAIKEPKHLEEILYKRNEEEQWDKTEISTFPLHSIIRDLLYYLEKNADTDAKDTMRHIFKMALGECKSIPLYACTKIQGLFERPKQHRQLKELLLNESESTNFKTYFLGLLIMESALRPYIERKITLIHTDVRHEFTRHKLCAVADTNDICRADGVTSDVVKFKHDCKKTPQCSKFLQCVLDKRPPKCKQKQYRMFKRVNPQDCLTNVWDFAKLFMDPWMHTNKGFEDLDVFCLLTLLDNVQMFDANQSKAETLQQKVSKARYYAFNVLQMGTKTMKKHTMNVRLHDLIYILEEGILPVPYRAIQQLKDLIIDNNKGHLFDIRLDREAKRQHCGQSLKKAGHGCWFKSIIALRHLNPVFVDIVEDEINKLHEKTVNTFGPKPCPRATSDDICKSANNTAKFLHICPPETPVACQKLLDIIKEHTAEKVSFCSMLKGTDPQIWLDSPFDYARIFLKKESRWKRGFEDCDMTDLCAIVERCKPLLNMFNNSLSQKIRNVHNQTMHAAEMEISQQEMEDNLDAILEFLQYIKSLKDTGDAAEAIDFIQQLQAYDTPFLSRLNSDLIDRELPDTKMKHVEDKAKALHQKIRYMKRDSERYCSLGKRPDSPSPGCYDEETSAKKGTTETLFSGDEDSIQPSTSSMRERSGRGEQTMDEPTDRARGAKRVLQETGSEEPVLMKKRKMAKKGRFETYILGNVSIQPSTSSMRERGGRGEQTRDEPTDRARGAKRVLQETGSEEPVLKRKWKMAEHIREMSEEQLKDILMKTVNKDPDVFEEITLI